MLCLAVPPLRAGEDWDRLHRFFPRFAIGPDSQFPILQFGIHELQITNYGVRATNANDDSGLVKSRISLNHDLQNGNRQFREYRIWELLNCDLLNCSIWILRTTFQLNPSAQYGNNGTPPPTGPQRRIGEAGQGSARLCREWNGILKPPWSPKGHGNSVAGVTREILIPRAAGCRRIISLWK